MSYLKSDRVFVAVRSRIGVAADIFVFAVRRILRGHSVAEVVALQPRPRLLFKEGHELFPVVADVADLD